MENENIIEKIKMAIASSDFQRSVEIVKKNDITYLNIKCYFENEQVPINFNFISDKTPGEKKLCEHVISMLTKEEIPKINKIECENVYVERTFKFLVDNKYIEKKTLEKYIKK